MTNPQEIEKILNGDVRLLVTQAESLGKQLAVNLKASQLRNVYGLVRQAQMEWQRDHKEVAYNSLILLQPKLAYFDKRAEARGARPMGPLKDALDQAISVLRKDEDPDDIHFKNFVDFCEAIVAYHKANRRDRD